MLPRFEYATRQIEGASRFFDDDEMEAEGWKRIWLDVTAQGAFVVYKREYTGKAETLRPPAASTPANRPFTAQDIHRAAYRVRRVLKGEDVPGVDPKLSHDYQLVHATISALKETQPLTRVSALIGKWRRQAMHVKLFAADKDRGLKLVLQGMAESREELALELEEALK